MTCTDCEAGKFQAMTNATSCQLCLPGYLQVAAGQTACNPCPKNEFSSEPGSYFCMNCEAESGEGFGSVPGSSACSICQPNYWFQTSTSTCVGCGIGTDYEGFDCSEGATTTATTKVKVGYWRVDETSDTLLACRRSEFCLGDGCREGHVGAYCSLCEVRWGVPGTRVTFHDKC